MVCSANDLLEWKDFPKGLRVLLVDENTDSASEIRSKLEEMDYIVSTFCNENDALSALLNNNESFHVAIVEVSMGDGHGSFKFLETAKEVPTIMTSNVQCLSTMMKCIALGAVEFLHKPLSVDKLKNIWQHVVHKAFNAGGSFTTDKESFTSMLNLQVDNVSGSGGDKFSAPSTPQIKQGERLTDDDDCQDHAEKESGEEVGGLKSVEITATETWGAEVIVPVGPAQESGESVMDEEDNLVDGCKSESNGDTQNSNPALQNSNPAKASNVHNSYGNKANRKKMKVDWTPELHKKFVHAVEQLGVDQAIPSRILELMKVDGLTRHNVASHLQKYRVHRRHILPKEDDRRWPNPRDSIQRAYHPHKPIMAFPPYHANQVYPVWGQPNAHPAGVPMWGPPSYPVWPQPEQWPWQPYPAMHADAWGCPVMPPYHGPNSSYPQVSMYADENISGYPNVEAATNGCGVPPRDSFDLHLPEDEIDKVVKEAMSKPWMPLPLGLKPPSTDTVLAELSRQGISIIPPRSHNLR